MACPGSAGAGCSGWTAQCIAILQAAGNPTSGLVDAGGNSMNAFNNSTWGITYDMCNQYCNTTAIQLSSYFDFQGFSSAMTNYFLPWIALTAQLPYENGGGTSSIIGFCLALGSPALITYSLMITIRNRVWVHKKFKPLIEDRKLESRYPEFGERVESVLCLLSDGQQAPLRASQERFWLSSLVVSPKNQEWWLNVKECLTWSRRDFTFSLIAQIMLAAFVWLFTIISASLAAWGNTTTALQIAAATLWIWLIPITYGWIAVGTQNSSGTIKRALEQEGAYRVAVDDARKPVPDGQFGIVVDSGLARQAGPRRQQTSEGVLNPDKKPSIPTYFGMDVCGDERNEGPIYNYARAFTWSKLATLLHGAFEVTAAHIDRNLCCPGIEERLRKEKEALQAAVEEDGTERSDRGNQPHAALPAPKWASKEDLFGNTVDTASYCGLQTGESHAIGAYSDKVSELYPRMFFAFVVAIFVQWSTTGSAIVMAYLTPTIGLGCRSGGYLIYGCAGTVVLLLLVVSMRLSHAAMRSYQTAYAEHADSIHGDGFPSSRWRSFLCYSAVITRFLGKTIAILNTLWLVFSSLFEYIGVYNNCWCKSCVASLRSKAWAVLYKTDNDFKKVASGPWVYGIIMSTTVCVVLGFAFAWGLSRTEKRSARRSSGKGTAPQEERRTTREPWKQSRSTW